MSLVKFRGEKNFLPTLPEPQGLGFVMRAKVYADHASDTTTWRSRTGFLVYLNCAPIYWMSKKQASVESSTFGSEFIASVASICKDLGTN